MDKKELLEKLEVEKWDEIAYPEQFIDIFENLNKISEDLLYEAINGMDTYYLRELVDSYMDDLIVGVPEDEVNLYSVFSRIKEGMLSRVFNDMTMERTDSLTEEIRRLHIWLTEEKIVVCKDEQVQCTENVTLEEALINGRLEKLSEGKFEFVFPKEIDYEIDIINNIDFDENDYDEMSNDLIHDEFPVIDSEDN